MYRMELYPLLISLFLSSVVFIVFRFLRFNTSSKQTPNLPPGPQTLPLIGNLHNLIGQLPHRALHRLALKHGPLMHLKLGQLSVVVVSSPELAKQVMKTHDLSFASRPSFSVTEIIAYGSTDVVWAPYGEYWRNMKKICVVELFTPKRVQSFRHMREQVAVRTMKWVASKEGSLINITEKISTSTFEIISRSAFGSAVKENDLLFSLFSGIFQSASGFDIADMFPSSRLLKMLSTSRRKLQKYHDQLDIIVGNVIQEHRVANSTDKEKEKHEDIVDILLKHQDEGSELHLTTDNIKAIITDLFVGGTETTATLATWALAEMIKHPDILEKAQHEVRQTFDPKGYVDELEIDGLEYLKGVMKETLRLHPPLPLLVPRLCIQKCNINGYEIPVDTKVFVNAWAISNDPSYWKNQESFQPERFLDSMMDYKGTSFEYIPFGAGRRICPGINSAMISVHLHLAMLLYHFDWTLPLGMKPWEMDMTEGFGATAPRKKPLCIIPTVKRTLM